VQRFEMLPSIAKRKAAVTPSVFSWRKWCTLRDQKGTKIQLRPIEYTLLRDARPHLPPRGCVACLYCRRRRRLSPPNVALKKTEKKSLELDFIPSLAGITSQ
jgi:hypothetical protein